MLLVRHFYPKRFTYSILWVIPTGAIWGEVSCPGTQRHVSLSYHSEGRICWVRIKAYGCMFLACPKIDAGDVRRVPLCVLCASAICATIRPHQRWTVHIAYSSTELLFLGISIFQCLYCIPLQGNMLYVLTIEYYVIYKSRCSRLFLGYLYISLFKYTLRTIIEYFYLSMYLDAYICIDYELLYQLFTFYVNYTKPFPTPVHNALFTWGI